MPDHNRNVLAGSMVSLVSLLAAAAYLYLGFEHQKWLIGLLVFFAVPIASILANITIKRNAVGAVTGIVWLLSITAYLYLGFEHQKWLIGLLVFFAVPIAAIMMRILTLSSGSTSNCGCGSCGSADAGQKS